MNEITIYRRIKRKFKKAGKDLKHGWWICGLWGFETVIVLIFLNAFPVLMSLLMFVPLAGVVVYMFLSIRKIYLLAKKFPLVYNKWLSESRFVDNVHQRSTSRAQPDSNYVKIDNYGLDYFDDVLNAYGDDKQKTANAIYNAITETSLVEEVNFFKKFKRFTKDMDNYRGRI